MAEEKKDKPAWAQWAEMAGKAAGALAVLGYLALRSHFNFLGLSSQTLLPVERYLAELAQFVVALVLHPDVTIAGLATILLVAATIQWTPPSRLDALTERARPLLTHPDLPWLLSALGLVLQLWTAHVLTEGGNGVVVGNLSGAASAKATRLAHPYFFPFLALATATVLAAFWRRPASPNVRGRLGWWVSAGIGVMMFVELPLLFGTIVRPTEYAVVEAAEPNSCALLLLDRGDALALWRADGQRGWIEIVQKSAVSKMRIWRTADILDESIASRAEQKPRPKCVEEPAR